MLMITSLAFLIKTIDFVNRQSMLNLMKARHYAWPPLLGVLVKMAP
jgi:hypothetical protein